VALKSAKLLDKNDPFWQRELKGIVSHIQKIQSDCQIFIFGSFVEGRFTDASDLDLAVIVPDGISSRELYKKIYSAGKFYSWPIDLLIFPQSHFVKQSEIGGVCFDIRETGVELYPTWRL
jgi:predicted nucleotidyltransferase